MRKPFVSLMFLGAWGRNRTGTTLPSRDFKSLASTCSATQASQMEAAPGFEPGIKVLQTFALPLGDAARERNGAGNGI
jgi:hypothetical protein